MHNPKNSKPEYTSEELLHNNLDSFITSADALQAIDLMMSFILNDKDQVITDDNRWPIEQTFIILISIVRVQKEKGLIW